MALAPFRRPAVVVAAYFFGPGGRRFGFRRREQRPNCQARHHPRYAAAVTDRGRSRTVYSTDSGRACPRCGWPVAQCRCASKIDQPLPDRITVRLSIEKARRGGKTVTVLDGLPRNEPFLADLARELKRACGTGGTVAEGRVEIQGDRREALRPLLAAKGWTVKG
jgi:translation initiation factor 1